MDSSTTPASRFRLSLRGLFALTAALAIALGAVLYANEWWLIVLTLLVSLGTVASIVVALLDRGPRRAFAIGFLAYMAVSVVALPQINEVGRKSPAVYLLQWLYPLIAETAPRDPRNVALMLQWQTSQARYFQEFYLPVGEQLWTLMFALASGYFTHLVYAKREGRYFPA